VEVHVQVERVPEALHEDHRAALPARDAALPTCPPAQPGEDRAQGALTSIVTTNGGWRTRTARPSQAPPSFIARCSAVQTSSR
jgi:hypothetical protein